MSDELKGPVYMEWEEYFHDMRNLAKKHGNMPMNSIYDAFQRTGLNTNPFVQNSRVKKISSLPIGYTKDQIGKMIVAPNGYEKELRETAHALNWSAYPFHKLKTTYQDLNSYNHYHYPAYVEDAKDEKIWREGRLLDKFNHKIKVKEVARQIVGSVMLEGKVAFFPRWEIDKAHNKVNYAYLQQLPSDWYKIVGGNSTSKYTIMFDMMYFLQPGSDWRQFGDLFTPYVQNFSEIFEPFGKSESPAGNGKKFVFSAKTGVRSADGVPLRVNLEKFKKLKASAKGHPMLYNQNGRWAYWVTLPVEKVWVFEADDTTATVASPLTGLFLAFNQLAALEEVQMAILQNPLVQIAMGEIPYRDNQGSATDDPFKLSIAGREYFEHQWYQMLSNANTGGIGLYMAPVENLHMETLHEAPNAINISTSGYKYAIEKSGMAGLIPISDNPRAGAVELSATLEERYTSPVYNQFMNMMNSIYEQMGLQHEWRFTMFGGLRSDVAELETAYKGLHEGLLSETFRYLALRGMSIWSDLSMSKVVKESGLLDMRIPMVSSYTISDKTKVLPPKGDGGKIIDKGGRPKVEIDEVMKGKGSEGQESDIDSD